MTKSQNLYNSNLETEKNTNFKKDKCEYSEYMNCNLFNRSLINKL